MAAHEPYHDTARDDRPVERTPIEARQGFLGRPVLMVLIVGLVLAMLAWAAAEFFGMAIDRQTPSDASQVTAPASNPALENENIVNDNPPAGEKDQPQPALVDPKTPDNL